MYPHNMHDARPTAPQPRIHMPSPQRNHPARIPNMSAPINMHNARYNAPQTPTYMPSTPRNHPAHAPDMSALRNMPNAPQAPTYVTSPSRTHPTRESNTQPPEPTEPTRHWGRVWNCCHCGWDHVLHPGDDANPTKPENRPKCNIKHNITGIVCVHIRCNTSCGPSPVVVAPPPKKRTMGFLSKWGRK